MYNAVKLPQLLIFSDVSNEQELQRNVSSLVLVLTSNALIGFEAQL